MHNLNFVLNYIKRQQPVSEPTPSDSLVTPVPSRDVSRRSKKASSVVTPIAPIVEPITTPSTSDVAAATVHCPVNFIVNDIDQASTMVSNYGDIAFKLFWLSFVAIE
jgi:hypothetical protein